MEKYIFDCRQKMGESPKYLKRNHKVSQLPSLSDGNYEYLKNKVFLTFDYSYYQHIPKTASMHVGNRINSLNSLVDNSLLVQQKPREGVLSVIDNNPKWKKQGQNNINSKLQSPKKAKNNRAIKKIKLPVNSMPGVGDYHCQSKAIQKRIVYDVKIRGKPNQKKKEIEDATIYSQEQHNNSICQANLNQTSKFKKIQNKQNEQFVRAPRNSKSANGYTKQRRIPMKIRKVEQQYARFISSIEISNVWKKLMQKHRLKGSKFDIYAYNQ